MRILLAEDDPMIGDSLRQGLRSEGFTVDWVQDGRSAERALDTTEYALVLLDLGLPKKDGLAVLHGWRQRGLAVPVLILTARDAVPDRVKGLDSGADDYLVKPFDLSELLARMRALLRRQAGRVREIVEIGGLRLDPAAHTVEYQSQPVSLSAREFALLYALLEQPGVVLSREQLEERLYGWGDEVESNTIEVHIHNLRRKLSPGVIRTVRGVGYRLGEKP
ncbi:MAG: response regulator transcription factor [Candidatus Competibacteraceae bacterium]|uniref:DNA-binding response regulator in two-component regulatory system with QseC n=1 Tax=Candidatus Contendobacter odensis Run_B_J11 TaxID=1400861 RepID=A0A7U7J3T9_9GAMM|nr:response regulator transcription factor [Candidatus Contendobacter odensis]MBK8533647.1 response regulator transcription factor [Candidatus Competibacteraceae bacterium]MBK8753999.1 response regulator transcription factor [Candidatus Competibacteraceae bacterium]CDH44550.1 DNA-binding response regulator in two-component regulatory system with QseC [Candidatus Contendobacter odensis Run_B_J11]